ncbi:frizzled-5 [Acyrthosiphon pisum]|uniref:Frizzled-2 n=1 Tax=Acyrthosiphon pisum TaxID=7029 RepID=A0A8R2B9L2_ACYPI|nr:frizzled-5 [Acyrthosiphon pisum]XP_029345982.1 frizzled-5 [Acyrthosiphon pisum]XP_029345983.1 frizzled-5 [Acyrthosiphon pisum]XP_029345984.1 frizzled-5 [Acyrthosiphon pisum]|eukprot:XP_008188372.2 PREDICTED: frizzled-5 [Acyrthosiphon pisum]
MCSAPTLVAAVLLAVVATAVCNMQPVAVTNTAAASAGAVAGVAAVPAAGRCEEITIPMCRGIGYNMTSMPNQLNHETQEEAGMEVHQFWPLVEINCSADLKFFLCSVYTPICIEEYQRPLQACRSVCERARDGCLPVMQRYGFVWPEKMQCDKLPVHGGPELCMAQDVYEQHQHVPVKPTKKPTGSLANKCKPGSRAKGCEKYAFGGGGVGDEDGCECKCRPPLVAIDRESVRYNRSGVSVAGVDNCAMPCRAVLFTDEEKDFASTWIALWSSICCVTTLMTLTTYTIDTQRFKYPEKPIVFLSGCYLMVSLGYLIRVYAGHDAVACEPDGSVKYNASGPTPCTLVFLLLYFFGMASSIWWVILAFTWFLAAGLKWGNEAIASYSQYFHLAAWLIPTVKSLGVLVMSAVDGDAFAGVCYVGNQNPDNLKMFVLAPLVVYLALGISFLLGGFVSLFRIRNVIKQQVGRSKADKLEKLMIRIGVFSVLYTVPASVVIGCHYYEARYMPDRVAHLACPCSEPDPDTKPVYTMLMLKYFMTLVMGVTSGVWIWSGKTVGSWKRLSRRLFGGGGVGSGSGGGRMSKGGPNPVLVNPGKQRKQLQYMPAPSVPGSTLPSSHHLAPSSSLHHHIIKQAPLSHV